jgi:hypothetical protein
MPLKYAVVKLTKPAIGVICPVQEKNDTLPSVRWLKLHRKLNTGHFEVHETAATEQKAEKYFKHRIELQSITRMTSRNAM